MLAFATHEPEQAVAQTGSHSVAGAASHWSWQSFEQHCAQEERHSPWFFASAQVAVQSCWQSDMQSPMQFGGWSVCAVHAGTQLSPQVVVQSTSTVAVQLLSQLVVRRAAQTFSPATISHFGVQDSVGTTSQDSAAFDSR
jgi:hypothetical protein